MRLALPPVSPGLLALAGLGASLLDLGVAAAGLLAAVHLWAPPQDLPWKPFRLDAPLGLASHVQFVRAAADPGRCRRTLTQGGVRLHARCPTGRRAAAR